MTALVRQLLSGASVAGAGVTALRCALLAAAGLSLTNRRVEGESLVCRMLFLSKRKTQFADVSMFLSRAESI